MSGLSKEQKDLILDFYFRCGSEEDINRGRDLIAADKEAAYLYAQLEDTLTQLDHEKYEPCPDNLVELTVARLKLAAVTGQARLEELLKLEQEKNFHATPARTFSFRNYVEVFAVAAVFLILTGLGLPTFNHIRDYSRKSICAANLAGIGTGIQNYADDNDGLIPHVRMGQGSPWFKLSYQGEENHSNGRHSWLLVRQGYVRGKCFTCPGQKNTRAFDDDLVNPKLYNDFPSVNNLSFSFPLISDESNKRLSSLQILFAGDRNPLFENVLNDKAEYKKDNFDKIIVDRELKSIMSSNHRGKGQNILQHDGSVRFIFERSVNGRDDIFTLTGIEFYTGNENSITGDIFLVP